VERHGVRAGGGAHRPSPGPAGWGRRHGECRARAVGAVCLGLGECVSLGECEWRESTAAEGECWCLLWVVAGHSRALLAN